MSRVRLLLGVVSLLVSCSMFAADGQHPNVERGFHSDQVYSFLGLDTVNVFNGNLNIAIPIGLRYPNGGGSTYGLSLVYNSKLWEWEHRTHYFVHDVSLPQPVEKVDYDIPLPSRRFNAGFGWMVTLGRLIDTDDPLNDGSGLPNDDEDLLNGDVTQPLSIAPLTYEGQDGNDHSFRPSFYDQQLGDSPPFSGTPYDDGTYEYFYTRDNAYLRLRRKNDADHSIAIVDFPDGAHHTFTRYTVGGRKTYRLTSITDAFGNALTITYPDDLTWQIADQFGRVQTIHFRQINNTQQTLQTVVDRIELSAPTSGTVSYYFAYDDSRQVARIPTAPVPESMMHVLVPMLTSLRVPDDPANPGGCATSTASCSTFDFTYGTSQADDSLLMQMKLPTGGRVQWAYGSFALPTDCAMQFLTSQFGVEQRTLDNGDGQPATWTYHRALTLSSKVPNKVCGDATKWFKLMRPVDPAVPHIFDPFGEGTTTVTDPDGNRTVNYFSLWPTDNVDQAGAPAYKRNEFGMPFTRRVTYLNDASLFLSAETYEGATKKRSTYVAYESGIPGEASRSENSRLTKQRTVFEDDGGNYIDETNSEYDGYGHFRSSTRSGSGFTPAVTETKYVDYNPGSTSIGRKSDGSIYFAPPKDWVINTFDYATTTLVDGSHTFTERQDVCFDATNGFLKGRRVRKNAATTSNEDIVTLFSKGTYGDVAEESWFGGDGATTPISDLCSYSSTNRKYGVVYAYSNGLVSSASYAGTNPTIYKLRQTVDSHSGVITSATDEAGNTTSYGYDGLGRLTLITPPAGALTRYEYSHGTDVPRVNVRMFEHSDTTFNKVLKFQAFEYDSLGRILHEITGNADGTQSIRTTLYDKSGRKWKVSEPAAPNAFTVFTYDAFGRVTSAVTPDSQTTSTTYTGVRKTDTTTPNATTSTTSDILGHLASVTEKSGPNDTNVTTDYHYDASGRLLTVDTSTTAGSQTRTFTYDGRGFLTSESHPEKSAAVTYAYDALGNVTSKTDNGTTLISVYDAAGRLTTLSKYIDSTHSVALKTFTYDSVTDAGHAYTKTGRLLKSTRLNTGTSLGDVTVSDYFQYEGVDGRLSKKITTLSNGPSFEQSISTDQLGLPDAIHYPWCTAGCDSLVGQKQRDITLGHSNGFLTLVSGYASSIKYFDNGMVSEVKHSNGVKDSQTIDTTNGLARPTSITFDASSACAPPVLSTLTAQLTNVATNLGTTLSITATGTVPMQVEWKAGNTVVRTDPVTISGSVLTYQTPGLTATTQYSAHVTNACDNGDVTSNTVTITVGNSCESAAITTQPPSSMTVVTGTTFTLTAEASGTNPAYQWYQNGAVISGATSGTLTTSLTSNATFYVLATAACGAPATSNSTSVTVVSCSAPAAPTVTPDGEFTIRSGKPVTLTATGGSGTYTWMQHPQSGGYWTQIQSGPSKTITVAPTTPYSYKVNLYNGCGSADSAVTLIDVLPKVHADFDGDGHSDVIWYSADYAAFAVKTLSGTSLAEFAVAGAGSLWQPGAVADLDGDSMPEVIWHNDDFGDNVAWKWNGVDFGYAAYPLPRFTSNVGDWRLVGAADWDGDTKEDLIFRNYRTGENQVWIMDGFTHTSTVTFESESDITWKIQGAFADGSQHYIAWHNSQTGANRLWSNVTSNSHTTVSWPTLDRNWKVRGFDDYDGDGKLDILWHWEGATGGGLTQGDEWYSADAVNVPSLPRSYGGFADAYAEAEGVGRPNDCTIAPTISVQADKAAICSGSSVKLTATSTTAETYKWSTNATTNEITVTAPGAYSVTAATVDGCSTSVPFNVIADTLPAPVINASPGLDVTSGSSAVLTASAGKSYSWSPGSQTTPSITVATAGSYHVSVTNANGCVAQSADSLVVVHPRGPAGIVATASQNGSTWSVNVTVLPAPGADANTTYVIQRSTNGHDFTTVATFPDTSISANTTYFYRALAHDSLTSKDSLSGPVDIATTVKFLNDPLIGVSNAQGLTPTAVSWGDVTSLRTAINSVRAAAGLSSYSFTAGSTFISSTAIAEMRTALNQALDLLVLVDPSLGRPAYTEPDLPVGLPVRAVHVQQLRDRVK